MTDDDAPSPGFLALIGYGGPYVPRTPVLFGQIIDIEQHRLAVERRLEGVPTTRKYTRREPPQPRECPVCARVFTPPSTSPEQRTCSRACGATSGWVKRAATEGTP